MRIAVACAVAVIASACQTMTTRPVELSADQLERIKREVAQQLKDPDSARFGRIAAGKADSGLIKVCGTVNGRNAFGAYGLESAFEIYANPNGTLSESRVDTIGPGASMGAAILNNCRADGVAV